MSFLSCPPILKSLEGGGGGGGGYLPPLPLPTNPQLLQKRLNLGQQVWIRIALSDRGNGCSTARIGIKYERKSKIGKI